MRDSLGRKPRKDGRYLAGLQRAFARGELHLTGALAPLAEPAAFATWLTALRQHAWVVYCQPPFAGPAHVLAYLGRYTHRLALSNDRLLALADGRVRFRWRDYADHDRVKVMELDADEFLRRFLLHIVPDRLGGWRRSPQRSTGASSAGGRPPDAAGGPDDNLPPSGGVPPEEFFARRER